MMRFFRQKNGLTFYAVDSEARPTIGDRYAAVTAIGIRKLGRAVRMDITGETLKGLQEISKQELPVAWQELFRSYFWRRA